MDKKKVISLAIIAVCLILSVFVFMKTGSDSSGIEDYKGEQVVLKCASCDFVKRMDKTEYFTTIAEKYNNEERPFECEECGKMAYRAIECAKCKHVFFRGAVKNSYADKCPECGYSPSQQER